MARRSAVPRLGMAAALMLVLALGWGCQSAPPEGPPIATPPLMPELPPIDPRSAEDNNTAAMAALALRVEEIRDLLKAQQLLAPNPDQTPMTRKTMARWLGAVLAKSQEGSQHPSAKKTTPNWQHDDFDAAFESGMEELDADEPGRQALQQVLFLDVTSQDPITPVLQQLDAAGWLTTLVLDPQGQNPSPIPSGAAATETPSSKPALEKPAGQPTVFAGETPLSRQQVCLLYWVMTQQTSRFDSLTLDKPEHIRPNTPTVPSAGMMTNAKIAVVQSTTQPTMATTPLPQSLSPSLRRWKDWSLVASNYQAAVALAYRENKVWQWWGLTPQTLTDRGFSPEKAVTQADVVLLLADAFQQRETSVSAAQSR